jgi:hypothetical protein
VRGGIGRAKVRHDPPNLTYNETVPSDRFLQLYGDAPVQVMACGPQARTPQTDEPVPTTGICTTTSWHCDDDVDQELAGNCFIDIALGLMEEAAALLDVPFDYLLRTLPAYNRAAPEKGGPL